MNIVELLLHGVAFELRVELRVKVLGKGFDLFRCSASKVSTGFEDVSPDDIAILVMLGLICESTTSHTFPNPA